MAVLGTGREKISKDFPFHNMHFFNIIVALTVAAVFERA